MITRALGVPGDSRADIRIEPTEPGDLFILCSDGLTGALRDAAIASWARREAPTALAQRLVNAAVEAGTTDNVTVVAVSVA